MWLQVDVNLPDHPKVRLLGRLLGIEPDLAMAKLQRVWFWAMQYVGEDGDLSRYPALQVAVAANWDGDADAFLASLKAARLVDDDGRLHDWAKYTGDYLRHLARNRAYKAQQRSVQRTDTPPLPHPIPLVRPSDTPPIPDRRDKSRKEPTTTKSGSGDRGGYGGRSGQASGAIAPVEAVASPPNKIARFIDAMTERGLTKGEQYDLAPVEMRRLKETSFPPEDVAACYAEVFRGLWGDGWLQQHLTVDQVLKYVGRHKAGLPMTDRPRSAEGRYLERHAGRTAIYDSSGQLLPGAIDPDLPIGAGTSDRHALTVGHR
jgi:hypothetical protein